MSGADIDKMIKEREKEAGWLLKNVKIFPGDISHYVASRGYPVEKIDMGEQNEGIILSPTDYGYEISEKNIKEVKKLIDAGLEAIVDAKPVLISLEGETIIETVFNNLKTGYYGLPVRKKQRTGKYA